MEPPAKGTVTPIASLFSEEEARKAVIQVEAKIGEKREEMNRLQHFVDENDNLMNLVKKLPDKLHHNVMVPLGKMAFFPGRLIHTNECLVLLGENYYTDRTSKQTVDVLRRRDKTLQSQIHSLKAEIEDFQTEASFFASTASEVAEGLVEIREEYDEEEDEDSSATVLQSGEVEVEPSGLPGGETAEGEVEDDEFARIMSRLNELEMEEEQGGEEHDSPILNVEERELGMIQRFRDETEHNRITRQEEATVAVPKKVSWHSSTYVEPTSKVPKKFSSHSSSIVEPRDSKTRAKGKVIEVLPEEHPYNDLDDPFRFTGPQTQHYLHKEDQSFDGIPQQNDGTWSDFQTFGGIPQQNAGTWRQAKTNAAGPQNIESNIQRPDPEFDSSKAFTGSIIEHAQNLETKTQSQIQSSKSQPSRPVSRFKAQKR